MKKYLNLFFAAMVAVVCSSAFVSCGGDDDEEDGGSTPSSSTTLKINGVNWVASTVNPPMFYGSFGDNPYGYVLAKFTKKEANDTQELFPDYLHVSITMNLHKPMTKGMDIVSDENVRKSDVTEFILSEGAFTDANYRYGIYDLTDATGNAIIEDFKENEFVTIKFVNFKAKKTSSSSQKNPAETLTIDGTVTFKYTNDVL